MPACPSDGQPLSTVRLSGVPVLGCSRCHGLWLSREKILELALVQAKASMPVAGRVSGRTGRPHPQRFCSVQCQSPLEPKMVRGIELDRCLKCDGYWFDGGEIQALLDVYGQKREKLLRRKVEEDFQHPLKRSDGAGNTSGNILDALSNVALDSAAEAVVRVVIEGFSSIDW